MITIYHGAGYKRIVTELLDLEVKTTVRFKLKEKDWPYTVIATFSKNQLSKNQFIQINDRVYKFQDVMENPYRIYTLMQQDLLKDSIEKLP